jgi:hypothetical protein
VEGIAHTIGNTDYGFIALFLFVYVCVSASLYKLTQRKNPTMYSPQDAITGSSGCLAIDLMLPEHFPKKQPNNFPVAKYIHYYREKKNHSKK